MMRVINARSLKFSEHRDNDKRNEGIKAEVLRDMRPSGSTGASTRLKKNLLPSDKNRTPAVIANVVTKNSRKMKRVPQGVWSPLGVTYQTHGVPDLDLGEEANLHAMKQTKRAKRIARDAKESRRKLEDLVSLFRSTKSKLQSVNLFKRHNSRKSGQSSGAILPTLNENKNDDDDDNLDENGEPKKTKSHEEMTTVERIAAFGTNRQQRVIKQEHEVAKFKQINHLAEDRISHIKRWRGKFEEKKDEEDSKLIQRLVARSQARDLVYDDPALLNNAMRIVLLKEEARSITGHTRLASQFSTPNRSIWSKAQLLQNLKDEYLVDPLAPSPHSNLEYRSRHQLKRSASSGSVSQKNRRIGNRSRSRNSRSRRARRRGNKESNGGLPPRHSSTHKRLGYGGSSAQTRSSHEGHMKHHRSGAGDTASGFNTNRSMSDDSSLYSLRSDRSRTNTAEELAMKLRNVNVALNDEGAVEGFAGLSSRRRREEEEVVEADKKVLTSSASLKGILTGSSRHGVYDNPFNPSQSTPDLLIHARAPKDVRHSLTHDRGDYE